MEPLNQSKTLDREKYKGRFDVKCPAAQGRRSEGDIQWKKILPLIAAVAAVSTQAQCCSPGNPSSGNQLLGSGGKDALRILSSYQFGYSDTYFRGNDPSDFRMFENARYQYVGLNLDFGLTSRTLAHFESGYYQSRRRDHSNPDLNENASGLSNGIAGLRHLFLPFSGKGLGWEGGVGLKFPFWVEPVSRNGKTLATEVQPSTRAFGAVAEAGAQWGFLEHGLRLIAYSRYERNFEDPENYAYGDLISPMIMASWSRWSWIAGQQFRWEWRTPDRWRGSDQVSTGSQLLWWETEAGYEFSPALRLTLAGGIPLYRNYRGTQLAAGYRAQVKTMFLIPGKGFAL